MVVFEPRKDILKFGERPVELSVELSHGPDMLVAAENHNRNALRIHCKRPQSSSEYSDISLLRVHSTASMERFL